MKTYSVMEMALRSYYDAGTRKSLKSLVMTAVESGVITDAGFRHVPDDSDNPYSKNFVDTYPKLRNTMAHGSNLLMPDCIDFLERCADVVNQLFPAEKPPKDILG